jgi:hypothetical protein
VNALEAAVAVARRYRAAAERHRSSPPPALLAVGGLSGSGKTTLARSLAPKLGAPPGAVGLRSDEATLGTSPHGETNTRGLVEVSLS